MKGHLCQLAMVRQNVMTMDLLLNPQIRQSLWKLRRMSRTSEGSDRSVTQPPKLTDQQQKRELLIAKMLALHFRDPLRPPARQPLRMYWTIVGGSWDSYNRRLKASELPNNVSPIIGLK
jgi:hypothetical protein